MNAKQTKLLIVDDDLRLRDLLVRYFTEQGMEAKAVADAAGLDKARNRERFDLIVLDLMLPGEDGLSICRRLRGSGDAIPIIILTAKGDEIDRIVGLEMGADDYLPKPFNPRELLARTQAVLRRQNALPPASPSETLACISFGECEFNPATRLLKRNGKEVPLTSGEFALLKALVANARQPLSRERLMELARGREYEVFDRAIDVQVSRLRKLIEVDPPHPRHIQTIWGFGYVFIPEGGTAQGEEEPA
jgi:DNA-binding response OmpR family regulator